jgi:hypothetical protein
LKAIVRIIFIHKTSKNNASNKQLEVLKCNYLGIQSLKVVEAQIIRIHN